MKAFKHYINEWRYNKERGIDHKFTKFPKTKDQLVSLIYERTRQSLLEPYLLDINTSSITDMSEIFSMRCNWQFSKIKKLDLHTWDVSNVEKMDEMFYNCKDLTYINIKGWKPKKLRFTTSMFRYCEKLENIDGLNEIYSNGYLNGVELMNYMFEDCNEKVIPEWYDRIYWNAR